MVCEESLSHSSFRVSAQQIGSRRSWAGLTLPQNYTPSPSLLPGL